MFDLETNTVDLAKKRPTEMRSNQRVHLVEPDCDDEREIKRDNLKLVIHSIYDQYINENCSKNGKIKYKSVDGKSNPIKVLNSIKEKVVDKELTVVPTDKTNRISVMSGTKYIKSMEEHYRTDKPINKKELNKIESSLCGHSKSVTKIFRVGLKYGQQKRAMANATVHKNGQIPVLKGAEKDHKENVNEVKMRPIVNAMDGP